MELTSIHQFVLAALPWVFLGLAAAFGAAARNLRNSKATTSHVVFTGVACISLAFSLLTFAAPNAFAAGQNSTVENSTQSDVAFVCGDDLLWAGKSHTFVNVTAPNDILAAGQTIRANDCAVNGSIRMAGMEISVKNASVGHSITLAGQTVSVSGTSTAQAVALCGRNATFEGDANSLWVSAENVFLDGVIHGDAYVAARSLQLGPNASIEGTLHATLGEDPQGITPSNISISDITIDANTNSQVSIALSGLFGFSLFWLVAAVLFSVAIAMIFEWLARNQTRQSAEMLKAHTGRVIGTGVIAALVAPIVLVVLSVTLIGIPVTFALGCTLVAIQIIACGFAGATLGKLAFPTINRFGSAAAMGAIVGTASSLPFVGWLVSIAAFMLLLGFILQSVYQGMRNNTEQEA